MYSEDVNNSKLTQDEEDFLKDVRRYGQKLARYDKAIDDKEYNTTESIFVYRYKDTYTNDFKLIYIVMFRGQFINYFVTKD